MKYEEVKAVQKFVETKVKECSDKNDYSKAWDKIKLENYGINYYSENYIRQSYSKMCGQTIYDYYRNCVYNSLVHSLMSEGQVCHLSTKQKVKGINKAKTKIESYFDATIPEIVEDKIIQIENIRKEFDKASYIKSREYNTDGSVTIEIDYENFIITTCLMNTPIFVNDPIKQMIEQVENINVKMMIILMYWKVSREQKEKIKITEEEFKIYRPYFFRINLYNPLKCGDGYWYIHDYTEQELTSLKIAFRRSNLKNIISRALILDPYSMEFERIDNYFEIMQKDFSVEIDRDKENIINILLELLKQGYLYFIDY
ncbi:hypothetical protein SAMN04487829_0009 [Pseudobutyrivibrio sp. NOR37]|uniref:Uncharacterized protein n=1 Tax=Pseudobutyrivibrio xylanivorans TaxID=185007 RepID=A0A6M0LCP6_PSEXY|nr:MULTISPECIES: hypothetical protein [Pseudobutyrivibrio]NEX00442.1 hypothetical protein [Pseudobutyrivibrio xylanivorans]SFR59615.1 hypothetical protein SAMN04487829_0009 [Pseudobutyrivibrio sp. NOR37]